MCEECAEKLDAAKSEGIDYFGEANDFRNLVDSLQVKLASSTQTPPEQESSEADQPQIFDQAAPQQSQISSTNLKNLFQRRQDEATVVEATLSFRHENSVNVEGLAKLDRLSLLPRQRHQDSEHCAPDKSVAQTEATAWAYGSLGRPTNGGVLVPALDLPYSSGSQQSRKSMASSPAKTLSHHSEETSHFNVSLERATTVGAKGACAHFGEDAPSLAIDTMTMSLASNQAQAPAHHHATPTLTDPVILVTSPLAEPVQHPSMPPLVAAQPTGILPYQKRSPSHAKKLSSEEEQEPYECPIAEPEPAPKRPRFSEDEDFTPAKVLVSTYINEHQRSGHTASDATTPEQKQASSAAKAVGVAPRPSLQIPRGASAGSTPQSNQRTRSSASASRNLHSGLSTPTAAHARSTQWVDLNLVASRRSVDRLEEFCARVKSESAERKASRRSRGSGSGSASRSNHSKKTAGAESAKPKAYRPGSSQSRRSGHSVSSKTLSRVHASALSRGVHRVDTVTDCPSELTPCAMNASDAGASALEPASEQAQTLELQSTHQDGDICKFRAADDDTSPEMVTIAAQPNSARVYVPHAMNALDTDVEYSRLSKKLRELKQRQP